MSLAATEFAPDFHSCEADLVADLALRRRALALRFQVYCIDCGYLDPTDYPDGLEADERDAASAHFCAFNRRDELVGYVRLVRPDAEGRFPFQDHCQALHPGVTLPPAAESAEISRLMVRADYRRRRGDTIAGVTVEPDSAPPHPERRSNAPQILLSLYRRMYHHSLRHGIRYWYAAMERPLARSLATLRFTFQEVGPVTDYFGPVAPYVADLRQLERRLQRERPELMDWMASR